MRNSRTLCCKRTKFENSTLPFPHLLHSVETDTDAWTAGFTDNKSLLLAGVCPECLGLCLLRILTICPLEMLLPEVHKIILLKFITHPNWALGIVEILI